MTFTQRLVRAGATFIILGTVAVMLPHNGAAQATTGSTTCANTTTNYRLTTDSGFADTYYTMVPSGTATTFIYAATSTNGGAYSEVTANYSYVNGIGNSGTVSSSSGFSTKVTPTGTGSGALVGTFQVAGGSTYTVQFPVIIQ